MKWLLLFILCSSVQAVQLSGQWTPKFEKEITVTCSFGEEEYCNYLCGSDSSCSFIEGFCRDCAGTNLYLGNLFEEMGFRYQRRAGRVDLFQFFDFLMTGDFITLSSRSIYNSVTNFDAPELQRRFRKLCGNQDPYPIVFLEAVGNARLLGDVRYVACNGDNLSIFEMEEAIEVIVNP